MHYLFHFIFTAVFIGLLAVYVRYHELRKMKRDEQLWEERNRNLDP